MVGDALAEEERQAVDDAIAGRQVEDHFAVVSQRHVQSRIRQCDARELVADVAELGRFRAEKLAPHGRAGEQVANLDLRAGRAAAGFWIDTFAAVDVEFRALVRVVLTGPDNQM